MSEVEVDARLDLSGVACPLNFVKTKLKLEAMEKGRVLEVILDDGEPIQMVSRSVKEDGHQVLDVEKLNEKQYRLLVEKAGKR